MMLTELGLSDKQRTNAERHDENTNANSSNRKVVILLHTERAEARYECVRVFT